MSWKILTEEDAKILEHEGIITPIDLAAYPLEKLEELFPPDKHIPIWSAFRRELAADNLGFIGPILKSHLLTDGNFSNQVMQVFRARGWISLEDVARDLTQLSKVNLDNKSKKRLFYYIQDCLTKEDYMEPVAERPDPKVWDGVDVDLEHPDIIKLEAAGYHGLEIITQAIKSQGPEQAQKIAELVEDKEVLLVLNQALQAYEVKLPIPDSTSPSPPNNGGSTIIADWFSAGAEVPEILAGAGITHRAQLEELSGADLAGILSRDGEESRQKGGRSRALRAAYQRVVGRKLVLKQGPPALQPPLAPPKPPPTPAQSELEREVSRLREAVEAMPTNITADDQLAELIQRTTALCETLENQQLSVDILDGIGELINGLKQAISEELRPINARTLPPEQLEVQWRTAVRIELDREEGVLTRIAKIAAKVSGQLDELDMPTKGDIQQLLQDELEKGVGAKQRRILDLVEPFIMLKTEQYGFEGALVALQEKLQG